MTGSKNKEIEATEYDQITGLFVFFHNRNVNALWQGWNAPYAEIVADLYNIKLYNDHKNHRVINFTSFTFIGYVLVCKKSSQENFIYVIYMYSLNIESLILYIPTYVSVYIKLVIIFKWL